MTSVFCFVFLLKNKDYIEQSIELLSTYFSIHAVFYASSLDVSFVSNLAKQYDIEKHRNITKVKK